MGLFPESYTFLANQYLLMLLLISSCSKWRLCHQSIPHKIPFGPLFWCQIIVEGEKVEREVSQEEKAAGRFLCLFAYRCVVNIILSMHVLTLLCFLRFICLSHLLSPNSLCAVNTAKDKYRNYVFVILSRAQSLNLNLVQCFPLPKSEWCSWLVVPRGKFSWTNQKG